MRPSQGRARGYRSLQEPIALGVAPSGRMPQTALRCNRKRGAKRSRTPLRGDRSRFDRPGFRTSPPRPSVASGERLNRPGRAGGVCPRCPPTTTCPFLHRHSWRPPWAMFLLGYRPEVPYGPPVSARLLGHACSTRPRARPGGLFKKPSRPEPASQYRRDRHGRSALGHAWRRR